MNGDFLGGDGWLLTGRHLQFNLGLRRFWNHGFGFIEFLVEAFLEFGGQSMDNAALLVVKMGVIPK